MNLFELFSKFSMKKSQNIPPHATPIETAYLEGFSKGFEFGLEAHNMVKEEIIKHIEDKAINDTLRRMNGNYKKAN